MSAKIATAPASAAPRSDGRAVGGSRAPSQAPTHDAATAIASPAISPSGSSAAGHGSGMNTCVQPHSAASPTVPSSAPDASASGSGSLHPQRDELDQQRLDQEEREVRRRLTQDGADEQRP